MNIAVCIKQVPNLSAMKFDPEKKTLVREGVPNEVSAFDVRALIRAVAIVKERGGEVVAVTMGPPQAAQALQHCLALGAHRALHLCDRAFAGSDTLATARALALALKQEKFDIIFCGRYSVDAETGQVGPEVAEFLGLPQVTGARALSFPAEGTARVERETDEGVETVDVSIPFLLTATEDFAPERFPTKKDREAAKSKPIKTVTAADLSPDPSLFGAQGSPTTVREIISVESRRACTQIEGATPAAKVENLVRVLRERGLGGTWQTSQPHPPATLKPGRVTREGRAIWVVAETLNGEIRPVTFELLGKAGELAGRLDGVVVAVLLGVDVRRHVKALAAHGADTVVLADHPSLAPYRTEPHADVLAKAVRQHEPHSLLFGSTSIGRDLAPRVAARLGLGLTADCIDLTLDEIENLVQHKPAFGGNIVAPIRSSTYPQMATVRPGILQAAWPDARRGAGVVELPVPEIVPPRTRVVSVARETGGEAAELDTAEIVVGFGMGIEGPENLPVIRELAAALKAPLATTRDCTDKGWLPRHHQVGLTGRSIAPRLYIAIAIRGAFEHTVGIRKAGIVVAINNDELAQIWNSSDYGLRDDWKQVVPLLTKAISGTPG